jgi:hypothetical protein
MSIFTRHGGHGVSKRPSALASHHLLRGTQGIDDLEARGAHGRQEAAGKAHDEREGDGTT